MFSLCFQASPRVRFNKEGSLLAVTTGNNGFKILASEHGMRLLRHVEATAAVAQQRQGMNSQGGKESKVGHMNRRMEQRDAQGAY